MHNKWSSLCQAFCFMLLLYNQKLDCCYLVVLAALFYGVSARTVVELLTELCVLPVVDGLTGRRWTTMIAR